MESRANRVLVAVGLISCMMGCGIPSEDEPGKPGTEGIASKAQALSTTFPSCPAPLSVTVGGPGVVYAQLDGDYLHVKSWSKRSVTIKAVMCGDQQITSVAKIRIYAGDFPSQWYSPVLLTACVGTSTCEVEIDGGIGPFFAQATDANLTGMATSVPIYITWGIWGARSLDASANAVPVNEAVTITATEEFDIGPSPFWIKIFDTTTGAQIAMCGAGTSCSVVVKQGTAERHTYQACLTTYGGTLAGNENATNELTVIWGDQVCYRAHVAGIGWQPIVCNGATAGTVGQGRDIEGIQIWSVRPGVRLCYKGHVQGYGWQGEVCDGELAGTTGQGRQLEAITIRDANGSASVGYRAHVQNIGWQSPVYNNMVAGTTGRGLGIEALTVWLSP